MRTLMRGDWIATALDAVARGAPLPAPFDDDERAWFRLRTDDRVPRTTVTSPDGRYEDCVQQSTAFHAMFTARDDDPLRAALDAIWYATVTFGRERYPELFTELRREFPAVSAHG